MPENTPPAVSYNSERLPDGKILLKPVSPFVPGDEIGTREAAKILGVRQHWVATLCDEGVLVEGKEWRKSPTRNSTRGGNYHIKRAAVIHLRDERAAKAKASRK